MSASLTAPAIRARKGSGNPLVMVTAYDAPSARMVDESDADLILVGDSLAMVVLGYDDTLAVTVDDMAHHTAAVRRAKPRQLVVSDLPWMSYHTGAHDAVRNAATLVRAGAQAVKLEGGAKRVPIIEAIIDAEIPVMGHLGLTPQSVHALGGYKVQGKAVDAAQALVADAKALEAAGCFAIVLECVPDVVARMVTEAVGVPTIGIGAGRDVDGQVLVFHDLLGIEERMTPKFVRRYATLGRDGIKAISDFAADVREGRFPADDESYHLADDVADALGLYGVCYAIRVTDREPYPSETFQSERFDAVDTQGDAIGASPWDDWRVRFLAKTLITLVVCGIFLGFLLQGANGPADPFLRPPAEGGATVPAG